MHSVGNDVVDLKEAANAGKSRDLRFLKKILTDVEIELVRNAENSDVTLWLLWACKEAACKVNMKSSPGTAFIPRRWQVVLHRYQTTYSDGEVGIPGRKSVFIRPVSHPQYVHCIAADSRTVLDKIVWSVEPAPEDKNMSTSLFLRECLAQNLARHYSLNFRDIRIERTSENGELQPPRVYIGGKKEDIDISLSHDGRFIAYAFLDETH